MLASPCLVGIGQTSVPNPLSTCHLAKVVRLLLSKRVAEVIRVPPVGFDVLYHPTKVKPLRVGTGSVPPIGCQASAIHVAGVTEPPFAFHVMVTMLVAAHLRSFHTLPTMCCMLGM